MVNLSHSCILSHWLIIVIKFVIGNVLPLKKPWIWNHRRIIVRILMLSWRIRLIVKVRKLFWCLLKTPFSLEFLSFVFIISFTFWVIIGIVLIIIRVGNISWAEHISFPFILHLFFVV